MKRIAFTLGDNLFVVRVGKTTNAKIADPKQRVVQTYTFSLKQWEYVKNTAKPDREQFFKLDGSNCLDCPLSGNSGNGKCYTHKYMQYSGFLSMLRSIAKDPEPPRKGLSLETYELIRSWCIDSYVRFGTYGEPSLLPIDLVRAMALNAKSWTGYTHQARKPWASDYKSFFMASAHSDKEAASLTGWRSFIAYDPKTTESSAVTCPASKEAGYKSICSKCSLCSGTSGKGRKNVKIQTH